MEALVDINGSQQAVFDEVQCNRFLTRLVERKGRTSLDAHTRPWLDSVAMHHDIVELTVTVTHGVIMFGRVVNHHHLGHKFVNLASSLVYAPNNEVLPP